jgi:pimeloyl-ACP methyl ester carboxylesterase
MSIVLNIIQALFMIVVAVVLVSYLVWRYETGNSGGAPSGGAKVSAGESILGIALEIGAVFIAILLYPLGFITRDASYSTLRHGERPIILCHGYLHNRSAFLLLGHRLRQAGRSNVVGINFGPFVGEVPRFAEQLSEAVNQALVYSGCDKVDLVGHSMGGLVVRYYIEKLGGAASVNAAVTIGAPHRGTKMATLGIFRSSEQFKPDSALITGFESPVAGDVAAVMTAIWSDFDSVVLPSESACLPEPYTNVRIGGVGHVAMLFSGRVFDELQRALSAEQV